jgi:hypothetical protein
MPPEPHKTLLHRILRIRRTPRQLPRKQQGRRPMPLNPFPPFIHFTQFRTSPIQTPPPA